MNSANKNKTANIPANIPFTFNKTKKLPEPTEGIQKGEDYIKWGVDNLYPDFLNKIFYESPYQSGIIRQKVFFIAGGGFQMTFGSPQDEMRFNEFLAGLPMGTGLEDLIEWNALDGEIYNGFALRGVFNRKNEIAYFEAVDFDKIRLNENETRYFYSENWGTKKQSKEETGYKEYKPYNPLERKGEFLIYYKNPSKEYRSGNRRTDYGVYPKPTYSGGIKDISTDIEMSSYHFHEILNSLKTGSIIYLGSGVPNPKDKDRIEEEIRDGITGVDTAGGVIIMYGKGEDQKPEIMNLNGNDLDKRYLMTEEAVQKKILVSHSVVTPVLFGIQQAGSLGNATELENGYNIFLKTYVRGRQKNLETVYNYVFKKILKIDATIELKEGSLFEAAPQVETPPVQQEQHEKKKDEVLEALKKAGKPRKKLFVVSTKEIPNEYDGTDETFSESKFLTHVLKDSYYFAQLLTDFQINVLNRLNQAEDPSSIAETLKVKELKVVEAIEQLREKGLINNKEELTAKGVRSLAAQPANIDKFEVRYSYEKAEGVDGPEILPNGRTRSFCSTLILADRLYTREEIDTISQATGRNVWLYRGGFWNHGRDDGGQITPWCRHIWKQNVIYNPNK